MVTGTILYAHLSYQRVTGFEGHRLVREHHSSAQRPYPPTMMYSISSPLWWCTREDTTLNISITTYPVIE